MCTSSSLKLYSLAANSNAHKMAPPPNMPWGDHKMTRLSLYLEDGDVPNGVANFRKYLEIKSCEGEYKLKVLSQFVRIRSEKSGHAKDRTRGEG